jgi:hypothetical protein
MSLIVQHVISTTNYNNVQRTKEKTKILQHEQWWYKPRTNYAFEQL